MNKKLRKTFLAAMSLLILSSCHSTSNEEDKRIEENINKLSKEYRDVVDDICSLKVEEALYYDTYDSEGNLITTNMGAQWDDKSMTYSKNTYNLNSPVERVDLFEGKEVYYIDLVNNKFYKRTLEKVPEIISVSKKKYPDPFLLNEKIEYFNISDISEKKGETLIEFDNNTSMKFDKENILLEESNMSAGQKINTKLSHKESDLDKIFNSYKDLTKDMEEVTSMEGIKDQSMSSN
ncbi:hypothetical protein [Anaerococcus sp. AGMB09787]|uniref:hypothetical protein n=1 Tax=Anaerococcus sp. AGMB09787 TaxID=2922869 RepID=UPI001FAEA76A|nr:hypothetical protein [Anaerococcus sp. AGMB09787]